MGMLGDTIIFFGARLTRKNSLLWMDDLYPEDEESGKTLSKFDRWAATQYDYNLPDIKDELDAILAKKDTCPFALIAIGDAINDNQSKYCLVLKKSIISCGDFELLPLHLDDVSLETLADAAEWCEEYNVDWVEQSPQWYVCTCGE